MQSISRFVVTKYRAVCRFRTDNVRGENSVWGWKKGTHNPNDVIKTFRYK